MPCRGTSDGKFGDGSGGSSNGWKLCRGEVSNEREVMEDIEDDFRRLDIVSVGRSSVELRLQKRVKSTQRALLR